MAHTAQSSASGAAAPARRLKIGFILARSFTLSAFALFVDTLRLASDQFDRSGRVLADWQVLGSTRLLITSICGIQVAPTSDFVDPRQFDYIAVVGGLLSVKEPVDPETVRFLKLAASKGVPLLGLCTGSFILAEAGLMKEHQTCVSWLHYHEFRERFPGHEVRPARLFNLVRKRGSCAGGSSAADLAAALVRRHISRDAERNALEVLQIEKARSQFDIQTRQPLYEYFSDSRVMAVLINMEQHLEGGITIEQLASSVGLSRRQLERLFTEKARMSPALAFRRLRLDRARHILLTSKKPIIEVALDVGFVNTSHFTKEFKRAYGQTPTEVRDAAAHDRQVANSQHVRHAGGPRTAFV
ncbi:AraC family transcriptional regulator [Sinorhizobium fredii USDA 205]|uniref:Helix-turn-helix domain-containing protein n=1 Tax=Rhizobium fredii TaxID=380 RepID=A0A844ACH8_RHIFR|nr:helix-turn-helix domain-containing protein [Sinorhizobium fredii]ASY73069.1 Transcriptional regulator containing an amidase domain and an AraC-type DNA-binding HTH domain [Sinorhizobium fredii CCBAU 83666]KSV80410.1 AraC family transcriptional regulator [Sinorhizobium fredii USDA 205]MQX09346.1 helix-turn-helix domain-containing protein [Sinorhizobium fredii]GEC35205.1 AraC family transcriptional regulator [Sinorhizobium fredii]GLS08459.1 AraC family transcriptional regulator [Sinorhizobium